MSDDQQDDRDDRIQGQHLHLEPTSGIAGDMAVAALVDAGVPAKVVTDAVARMRIPRLTLKFERRMRGAYVGRGFVVALAGEGRRRKGKGAAARAQGHAHDHTGEHAHAHPHDHDHDHADHHDHDHDHDHGAGTPGADHEHRDHAQIRRLIKKSELEPDVSALALELFARVAEVEAELHGEPVDRVRFHEVGAYDSIADIVGVSAAIAWLRPTAISSSPPVVGTGRVRTAHGIVPVPAPATAALLRGIPLLAEGVGELTTPTGAAVLATVVDSFGPPPPMTIQAVGYGAGTRELADRPNVLRVLIGAPVGQSEPASESSVVMLEANLDDMNPQLLAPLFDALLVAGAVDVWSTPILMKKGRPALAVSALVPPARLTETQRAFFLNSTTLGLRVRAVERTVLARAFATAPTPYGPVKIKVASLDGELIGAHPEFDDCRRLAAAAKVPVRVVMAAASVAAAQLIAGPPRGARKIRKR